MNQVNEEKILVVNSFQFSIFVLLGTPTKRDNKQRKKL